MAVRSFWWSLKSGAKELVLWSLYGSGIAFIYSRLFGRKAIILCYHTVSDAEIHAYPNNVISERAFREQMLYVQQQATVVALDDCVQRFRQGVRQAPRSLALTFDDGYKSCLDTVAPILQEHHFPATFFVVPGFIDGGDGKWDDVLYFAMKPFSKALCRAPKEEIVGALASLERAGGAKVGQSKAASARDLLTWDEAKALRALGHSIQSHSMQHYYLGAQSLADQEQEIAGSKDRLEEVLQEEIKLLAYPFGSSGSYTEETKALAERAGYEAAFTCEQGYVEDSSDAFSMRRLGISADMPAWKFKLMLWGLYF